MPPPPPPPTLFLFFLFLSSLLTIFATSHTCTPTASKSLSGSSCPPFTSAPPFPFSTAPGCGHPSFQLKCSSPHSIITINNLSFALLSFEPNSSSLSLSPRPHTPTTTTRRPNCSSLSIPNTSINLSGSPFRVSDSSCSRLYSLRSCPHPNLPSCSLCPWDCNLIKNPRQLLQDCRGSTRDSSSLSGCQHGVLEYLDEFMRFGFQVEYDESQDSYFSNCRNCKSKNGVCGFNDSDPGKGFICSGIRTGFWLHQDDPNRIAVFCSIFTVLCLLLVVVVIAAVFRSRHLKSLASEEDPTSVFLHRHRSGHSLPPVFTFEELESSTNRFDAKRKIGDGGFGSVYLGQLYDGRIVAVKYLHKNQHQNHPNGRAFSTKSFCNEILILSSINHQNLVKLHGYCSDPRGLLLVYDYVPNGTLADHLHGLHRKTSLTWQTRIDIALQTALAIEYLHFTVQPAVVHRDITSSNIFVEKDMRIKMGDFGLSRLLVLPEASSSSSGYVCTGPQGTPGYLDPDYYKSFRLTEKSDVYSFGVVLLELITGLKAVDQSRDKREMALADLVVSKIQQGLLHQVVDPTLKLDDGNAVMDGVNAVAELAFRCVAADKDDRPDSGEVVEELKRVRSRVRVK